MKIEDIKKNRILPFEMDDQKLTKLFSFFLHSAPTIESESAMIIDAEKMANNWLQFKVLLPQNRIAFYSASYPPDKFVKCLAKYGLDNEAQVNRRTKAFVVKMKERKEEEPEQEYQCLLRHIRNSIAHGNVYLSNAGNRKYILFEDFNKKGNMSARILLSQADLAALKREIMK